MDSTVSRIEHFLATLHPYDRLPPEERARLVKVMSLHSFADGDAVYAVGEPLPGLYIVKEGRVEVEDEHGNLISLLGPGNSFGERGLMRDGAAITKASAVAPTKLLMLPAQSFRGLIAVYPAFERFFDRSRPEEATASDIRSADLATTRIDSLMSRTLITCAPEDSAQHAADLMSAHNISCLPVLEGDVLRGLITNRALIAKVLAKGLPAETPIASVMNADPTTLSPEALGADVLHEMLEHGIWHLPVVEEGKLLGVITQTNLTRHQAVTSGHLVHEIVGCETPECLAKIVHRIPELLAQLVGAGHRHDIVTRRITDIADATTRRLLRLAEDKLGPAPIPYLWLACGSQGRQEQTGVSDQDNCLVLDDAYEPDSHGAYFEALAKFVSDGLDVCGYFYCPGDMMATNPRWRQPVRVWREYFRGWIDKPDPMAQMLASVMFDLRPIGGEDALYADLIVETLEKASANSIFVSHMIVNSLGHQPPLGMFGGFATIRSGEHKDMIDLKHNGVVPIVDLGRVYALEGKLQAVNTRARLKAALSAKIISASGAHDLLDAYDLIAETRLRHQADQVKAGEKPDNFMVPAGLSDLERSHLRDAFVVVKTMQSALASGRSIRM
ncbi:MAG: DUF294 nucleotidyltransferase-like domain-containing protein [Neomegalonema sp.]|nr:DUF294 nucleotidyltransferase-like domain-containing protein [Neomegalonema sp.]